MEWSSDGYVLAVGWRHGWGIFSVGGRCLASGFGVDDLVDEERYVFDMTVIFHFHALCLTLAGFKMRSCMVYDIWCGHF